MPEPEAKRPRVILKGKGATDAAAAAAASTSAAAHRGAAGNGSKSSSQAACKVGCSGVPAVATLLASGGGAGVHAPAVVVDEAPPIQRHKAVEKNGGKVTTSAAQRCKPFADRSVVAVFDVSGKKFKVSASLIRKKGGLLKRLLDERNSTEPVFVDASADRFPYFLDWYRHGQIFVPKTVSLPALLRDAQYLELPESVIVNGVAHSGIPDTAAVVAHDVVDVVLRRWPTFKGFFERLLERIRTHFHGLGENSAQAGDAQEEEAYDFTPFVLTLYGERGWRDPQNLCSGVRVRVLACKLEEHGFLCEFTDIELLVSLPLKLRGELSQGLPEMTDMDVSSIGGPQQ